MASIHSKTYIDKNIFNIVHRERLRKIIELIDHINLPKTGKWGDFGCSDGFILSSFQKEEKFKNWRLYGFDRCEEFLHLARKKNKSIIFKEFDLNRPNEDNKVFFNFITCFETLEHVGNYKIAFDNLYFKLKPEGILMISVPNEIFLPGIIKFLGRRIKRGFEGYKPILKNKKEKIRYLVDLVFNRDIEKYRNLSSDGFGPHVGFNYKNLEKYIKEKYIKIGKLIVLTKRNIFFGFCKLYLFQKLKN